MHAVGDGTDWDLGSRNVPVQRLPHLTAHLAVQFADAVCGA